jgi:hypothetical protein
MSKRKKAVHLISEVVKQDVNSLLPSCFGSWENYCDQDLCGKVCYEKCLNKFKGLHDDRS